MAIAIELMGHAGYTRETGAILQHVADAPKAEQGLTDTDWEAFRARAFRSLGLWRYDGVNALFRHLRNAERLSQMLQQALVDGLTTLSPEDDSAESLISWLRQPGIQCELVTRVVQNKLRAEETRERDAALLKEQLEARWASYGSGLALHGVIAWLDQQLLRPAPHLAQAILSGVRRR